MWFLIACGTLITVNFPHIQDIEYSEAMTEQRSFVEVWQNQRYWPINGWDSQQNMQYSTIAFESGSDLFPIIELSEGYVVSC